ncbi:MAG: outer membrane protein assembly factor BamD [Bacteriovoracaceae bacterium]|nr:outer membrane protein assembly factor BamD [Bacteriovoracaceae bacterium]
MFKILFLKIIFFSIMLGCSTERPSGKTQAEILFKEAKQLADKSRFLLATEKLNTIRSKYPYSYYATHAELLHADILFSQDNYSEAAAAYIMFKDFHPKHPKLAYVVWRISESFFNQLPSTYDRDLSSGQESIKHYSYLIQHFPNSEYKQKAQDRIRHCRNMIEMHEKYVADFYYKTGDYDAAIFRYKYILNKFDTGSLLEHSMKRIVEASFKMEDFVGCVKVSKLYKSRVSDEIRREIDDFEQKCQNKIVHKAD